MYFDQALLVSRLPYIIWPSLAIVAILGLCAVLSPKVFARISASSSTWIDSSRLWRTIAGLFDRRCDVDQHVLRYSRVFGALVLAATAFIAYTFYYQLH